MAEYNLGTARGKVVVDSDTSAVAKTNEELDRVPGKGDRAAKSLNFKGALQETSTAAVVMGASITGGLALAVKSASDFEYGMSQIQSVLGLTTAEMEPLREAALRIGKDTAFSASEAALAMEELAKSGISASDILNGAADATVALAAAGQIELPEAASIAATALNQFKLGAEDMTNVADIMAGAANASATGVSEIGMALSFVGPLAQTAGISFEETAGMIALFANAGIDSARAGTALRAMITSLSNPTAQATEAMQALGLATEDGSNVFFDAEGNMKSMTETTDLIRNAFSGLTTEQQLLYGEMIFGSAQLSALGAITSSTAEDFAALNSTIQNTSAADVAQTRMGNLKGTIEEMWGSVETAAIKIGNVLIPAVTAAASAVGQAVDWFSNLDKGLQQTIVTVAAAVGGFLLFAGMVTKIVVGAVELFSAVKTIVTVIKSWEVATKAMAAAQAVFNAIMSANPIGLIVTAIAAVVAALIWFFTQTELGQDIVKNVTQFITEAWANVSQFLGEAFTNIGNFFRDLWEGIVAFIGPIIDTIVAIVTNVVTGIVNAFNAVVAFLTPIFEVIAGLIRFYIEMWVNIFLILAAVLTTIWNGIVAVATAIWQAILDFITPIINNIASFINTVFTEIGNFWRDFWNAIISFLTPIILAVYNVINDSIRNVQNVWNAVWGAISSFFSDIWSAIVGFLTPIIMRVYSVISSTVSTIQGVWNSVWSAISSFFTGIWNGIVSAVQGAVQSVFDIVGGIQGTIMGFFSGVGDWLYQTGKDIIQGMIDGITSMFSDIVGAIGDVVNGAIDWAKGVLGIASPSKVFADIGNDTMLGLIQGIHDLEPELNSAMNDLGLGMSADVTNTLNSLPFEGEEQASSRTNIVNYYAQPGGAQLDSEEELFTAMRRAKIVAPGW